MAFDSNVTRTLHSLQRNFLPLLMPAVTPGGPLGVDKGTRLGRGLLDAFACSEAASLFPVTNKL